MIDPMTRLRVGGSMDLGMLTRIVTELTTKVENLELQVKVLTGISEESKDNGKVSKTQRKTNKST